MSECENCKNSEKVKAGSYKTINGGIVIQNGTIFKCQKSKIKEMNFINGEMICSEYEERGKE